jgi:hypothetical protein
VVYGTAVRDAAEDYERALVSTAAANVLQEYWQQCEDMVASAAGYWEVCVHVHVLVPLCVCVCVRARACVRLCACGQTRDPVRE